MYNQNENPYNNLSQESEASNPYGIETNYIKKIKINYLDIDELRYSLEYPNIIDYKNNFFGVVFYKERNESDFKVLHNNTLLFKKNKYDFKVSSVLSDNENKNIIISCPTISESLEIKKEKFSEVKINSENKENIIIPVSKNTLITNVFESEPLFYKFAMQEDPETFSLIDENDNSIFYKTIEENEGTFHYFNPLNAMNYYCVYDDKKIKVEFFKAQKNFNKYKDNIKVINEKELLYIKEKISEKIYISEEIFFYDNKDVYKVELLEDIEYGQKIKFYEGNKEKENFILKDGYIYILENSFNFVENIYTYKKQIEKVFREWKYNKYSKSFVKYETNIKEDDIKNQFENNFWVNESVIDNMNDLKKDFDDQVLFYEFVDAFLEVNENPNPEEIIEYYSNFDNYFNFRILGFKKEPTIKTKIIAPKSFDSKKILFENDFLYEEKTWEEKIESIYDIKKETHINSDYDVCFYECRISNKKAFSMQEEPIKNSVCKLEEAFDNLKFGKSYKKGDNEFVENEKGNFLLNLPAEENFVYGEKEENNNKKYSTFQLTTNCDNEKMLDFYKNNFKKTSIPLKSSD